MYIFKHLLNISPWLSQRHFKSTGLILNSWSFPTYTHIQTSLSSTVFSVKSLPSIQLYKLGDYVSYSLTFTFPSPRMLNSSWSSRKWIWTLSLLLHFTPPRWPLSSRNHLPFWNISRWHSGKESVCQCRRCKRCRFNPWIRKIPPEKAMPTGSSTSGLESSMEKGAWWASTYGVAKSQTKLSIHNTPFFLLWSTMIVSSSLFIPVPFSCWQQNVNLVT